MRAVLALLLLTYSMGAATESETRDYHRYVCSDCSEEGVWEAPRYPASPARNRQLEALVVGCLVILACFAILGIAKHIHVKHQQAHAMAAARDDDDDALPPELERVLRPVEPLAPDDEATRACSVCMENRASICFVPCAHQNLCDDCTEDWWYAKPAAQAEWHCPTCRAVIETAVRPYQ